MQKKGGLERLDELKNKLSVVYTTLPDISSAKQIAAAILSEKLAFCVNIMDGGCSMFLGDTDIEQVSECYAIFKLSAEKLEVFKKKLINLHPYQSPCMIVLRDVWVNQDFLKYFVDREKND